MMPFISGFWDIAVTNPAIIFSFGGAVGSVAGFLVSRLTLSKSEKVSWQERKADRAQKLQDVKNATRLAFFTRFGEYTAKKGPLDNSDFTEISNLGLAYFDAMRAIATAIEADRVDHASRDNLFMPDLEQLVVQVLPHYYKTMSDLAKRLGQEYPDKPDMAFYRVIVRVVEAHRRRAGR